MLANRMKRELSLLEHDPPSGVCGWPKEESLTEIEAQIKGPEDSPYEGGVFTLEVTIPDRYPFIPPQIRFLTPVYHPNVDASGLICLDTLKSQPKGSWTPSLNIPTVLAMIRQLLAHPNPDDGLVVDISVEYRTNLALFEQKAREHTKKYASA